MKIPKSLYIDQFNFKAIDYPHNIVSNYICDSFNSSIKEVLISPSRNNRDNHWIDFIHNYEGGGDLSNRSMYNTQNKTIYFSDILILKSRETNEIDEKDIRALSFAIQKNLCFKVKRFSRIGPSEFNVINIIDDSKSINTIYYDLHSYRTLY